MSLPTVIIAGYLAPVLFESQLDVQNNRNLLDKLTLEAEVNIKQFR